MFVLLEKLGVILWVHEFHLFWFALFPPLLLFQREWISWQSSKLPERIACISVGLIMALCLLELAATIIRDKTINVFTQLSYYFCLSGVLILTGLALNERLSSKQLLGHAVLSLYSTNWQIVAPNQPQKLPMIRLAWTLFLSWSSCTWILDGQRNIESYQLADDHSLRGSFNDVRDELDLNLNEASEEEESVQRSRSTTSVLHLFLALQTAAVLSIMSLERNQSALFCMAVGWTYLLVDGWYLCRQIF